MKRRFLSVRFFLSLGLLFSVLFSAWSIYYKTQEWGFNLHPNQKIPVWTIESHLTFQPTGKLVEVSFSRPDGTGNYKILDETVIAKGYEIKKEKNKFVIKGKDKKKQQNIYYRILVYDTMKSKGKTKAVNKPEKPALPSFSDDDVILAKEVLLKAKEEKGDIVQNLIRLLNDSEPNEAVLAFSPERKSTLETAQIIVDLLALEGIPARLIRGIVLAEGKKASKTDVLLEAYQAESNRWLTYHVRTGEYGIPESFIVLRRGDDSLVDVVGGVDSQTKYSVLKSLNSSFGMAKYRAQSAEQKQLFAYSIYSLPIAEQNALKWLMIFPLAILIVVLLRNVVGLKTMGTFTPMLISMALIETGFLPGLTAFVIVTGIGLAVRALLSRLNLLLVPRISAVVIFVIFIIQMCTIIGYRFDFKVASAVLFFPIIILAWIIERASIIWEEEGLKSALNEVFSSVSVAVITYFVIVNPTVQHIMFAFNELNLVILFVVMLLGTYTGYRLTELKRFAPLVRHKDKK